MGTSRASAWDLASDAVTHTGCDAFLHYTLGCYQLEKRTGPGLNRAIEHFEAASRIAPAYVPAIVGLATAYTWMAAYWYAPAALAFAKARATALRALALDPGSAAAHAVLSAILLFNDWDRDAAAAENDAALRLNPSSAFVRTNAAWLAICLRQFERALEEIEQALALDPSSPSLQLLHARALLHAGDFDGAIAALSVLIEGDPESSAARRYRAQAYVLSRRPDDALRDLLVPQDHAEDVALRLPLVARAYADMGETRRAEEMYRRLAETATTEFVANFNFAIVATGLGRFEEALERLERAAVAREPALLMLGLLPWFEPLARRARFRSIVSLIATA